MLFRQPLKVENMFDCLIFFFFIIIVFCNDIMLILYRKIPIKSPWADIFQRPFLRGLYLEGVIYEGKFAFQNCLGLYLEGNLYQ